MSFTSAKPSHALTGKSTPDTLSVLLFPLYLSPCVVQECMSRSH